MGRMVSPDVPQIRLMIAPSLGCQGSFEKERRSDSYARLNKIFHGGQESSEGR
jgi:hypothetical protein